MKGLVIFFIIFICFTVFEEFVDETFESDSEKSDDDSIISSSGNEYSSSADESESAGSEEVGVPMDTSPHRYEQRNSNRCVVVDSNDSDISDIDIDAEVAHKDQNSCEIANSDSSLEHNISSEGDESHEDIAVMAEPMNLHEPGKELVVPCQQDKEINDEDNKEEMQFRSDDGADADEKRHFGSDDEADAENEGAEANFPNIGMSDIDMNSLIDKLTNDDDIMESETCDMPPFEEQPEKVLLPLNSDKAVELSDGEKDSLSSKSEGDSSGEEFICNDSDVTDEEGENAGEWNVSPVYGFETRDGNDEMNTGENHENLPSGEQSEDGPELISLKKDVQGLMEEIEILNRGKTEIPSFYGYKEYIEDDDDGLTADQILVIHERPVECGKSVLSDPSQKAHDANDLCHVKFFSPTNLIFYDPESPVVERVSVELSDELNDSEIEERLQEVESELERTAKEESENNEDDISSQSLENDVPQDKLEAEVVKDLKSVLEDITFKEEEKSKSEGVNDTPNLISQDVLESADIEEIYAEKAQLREKATAATGDVQVEPESVQTKEENAENEQVDKEKYEKDRLISSTDTDSLDTLAMANKEELPESIESENVKVDENSELSPTVEETLSEVLPDLGLFKVIGKGREAVVTFETNDNSVAVPESIIEQSHRTDKQQTYENAAEEESVSQTLENEPYIDISPETKQENLTQANQSEPFEKNENCETKEHAISSALETQETDNNSKTKGQASVRDIPSVKEPGIKEEVSVGKIFSEPNFVTSAEKLWLLIKREGRYFFIFCMYFFLSQC